MRAFRVAGVLLSALVVASAVCSLLPWLDPHGAVVTLYRGTNFERRVWMTTTHQLAFSADGRPARLVGADHFSGRWTAWLVVPTNAEYAFATLSDDGIRLLIDGEPVIENWRSQKWTDSGRGARKQLTQGRHPLTVEFYDDLGGARFRVEWCGGPVPPRTVVGEPFLLKRF